MFSEDLTKIGSTLVEYCNTRQEEKGLKELYAADAVSIEAADMMGMGREAKGIEAIKGKHD
ncbi:MAG: nuclear transport factor 2 family protein, partial [Pseudomonadota bacterium]